MIYFQIAAVAIEMCLAGAALALLLESVRIPDPVRSPAREMIGNIFIYLTAAVFIFSGTTKLAHAPLAVTEMTLLRLTDDKYLLVVLLEILGGLLLLIKPLRSIALLFVSAHMGGAICAHLIADQYFAMVPSAIILSLCWVGMFLRYPQTLWSLR
jgi:hypothetical protein